MESIPSTKIEEEMKEDVDFLIIGSGIAGLSYALKVAEHGSVMILTKAAANEGCTRYAQGGLCAVTGDDDTIEDHIEDTLRAGRFVNDEKVVRIVCEEASERVQELIHMGTQFTRNKDGSLHLVKEGGHSARRIVHVADMTGKEIETTLLENIDAHKNIRLLKGHMIVDLLIDKHNQTCIGAEVFDSSTSKFKDIFASSVLLACGGAGQIFSHTSNPNVATGDGIAIAIRAGVDVSDLEFVQFHPTSLYDPKEGSTSFIITEALRGEGGILYNKRGERFMEKYDPVRMELAPRDVVSRSIFKELLNEAGDDFVLLDISHKDEKMILEHFPTIYKKCAEIGIDMTKQPIPVVPTQHYLCGGISVGLFGETKLRGLYACGEVSCTGLHGANRLASNSLLECIIFAHRASSHSIPLLVRSKHTHLDSRKAREAREDEQKKMKSSLFLSFKSLHSCPSESNYVSDSVLHGIQKCRSNLQSLMWNKCGIIRSRSGLEEALCHVNEVYTMLENMDKSKELKCVLEDCFGSCMSKDKMAKQIPIIGIFPILLEFCNLTIVAKAMLTSALERKESRGGHYCIDYPNEMI